MLKTILIIALIAGAILASIAFCAYVLKVDFAINIMNTITQPFSNLLTGDLSNLQTIASGASIATAATSAIGWIKSNKDKVAAQAENVKQLLANKELEKNYSTVTGQLEAANKVKDEALQTLEAKTQEFQELADKVAEQKRQLEAKDVTIDTLHDALRRDKLEADERIEKIIVK